MTDQSLSADQPRFRRSPWSGVLVIVVTGVVLGTVYNAFGLAADRPWGLNWIAKDRLAALPSIDPPTAGDAALEPAAGSYSTDLDDPLAIPSGAAAAGLSEIPAVGRPVRIELATLRQYFDADAALIVDARDPVEFDEGHIPGAINLPYGEVMSDPSLVEAVRTGGRPIITYCGGEGCEVSLSVAEELCFAGHERVAVYVGGFPEWDEAGNPVARNPDSN
jgi:rhodanese-related sulfurtransferase